MLSNLVDDWGTVLDLYAGTGALGIEALSRGADHADFVERNREACAAIRQNLKKTGFESQGTVYQMPVRQAFEKLNGPYAIVLLDAPYADLDAESVLQALQTSPLVATDTFIVFEHARDRPPSVDHAHLEAVKSRQHGSTGIVIYRPRG